MSGASVALCLIVRDEVENLAACLGSVHGLVNEIWVVDTGSSDGTVELAPSLHANVLHFPWTNDFAAARNAGIERVQADWILVLDADECLTAEGKQLIAERLVTPDLAQVAAFVLPVHSLLGDSGQGQEISYNVRLFRNRPGHRYQGAVHEQIQPSIQQHSPDLAIVNLNAPIRHYGYLPQAIEGKRKPERNLAILQRLLEQTPDDWHLQYHAAVCLYNLQRFDEAVDKLTVLLQQAPLHLNYVARSAKILVVILRRQNRIGEALAVLDRYQSNWPAFTDLEYLRAELYRDRGDLGRALEAAIHCRQLGDAPPPFDSHSGLGTHTAARLIGELAEELGNQPLAERAYGEVPVGDPAWTAANARWLKLLAERVGPWPAALRLARRLPLPSDNALLAEICAAAGLPQPALQFMQRAAGVESARRQLFLADCLFRTQQVDSSVSQLQAVPTDSQLWPQVGLRLIGCALVLRSRPLLTRLAVDWGRLPAENQRWLALADYLLGGERLPGESVPLLVPLLRLVAPQLEADCLERALQLAESSPRYDQWLPLSALLLRDYQQPELAWRAYGRRQAAVRDPWFEAAALPALGQDLPALQTLLRLLPDARARVSDFLQAARLSLNIAEKGGAPVAD